MNIAIHGRLLLPDKMEGIGRFTEEVLLRWAAEHPRDDFYVLFDRSPPVDQYEEPNIHLRGRGPRARHPLLYLWWFERQVPPWLEDIEADVFISPDGFLPLNSSRPSVAVVHDVAHQYFRQGIGWWHRWYYDRYMPKFIDRANRIATVSEYSKQTIVETYSRPPEEIDVVYNGCKAGFAPISTPKKTEVRQKYSDGHPYFLYLGAIHPRKNVSALLDAYAVFRKKHPRGPHLLLAGRKAWKTHRFEQKLKAHPFRADIKQLDYVPENELPDLMGAADGFCYVSLFEGFGLPVLEALHAEVPVITSDVSSLPEVAGEAALKVSPDNSVAIARAMGKLYTHDRLVEELIEEGREQRKKFSWKRTADLLYQSAMNAVEESLKNY